MGMFNHVSFEMPCPICSKSLQEWQTKDGNLTMETVPPLSVNNFYTYCDKCKKWIEFNRAPAESMLEYTLHIDNYLDEDENVNTCP